MKTYLFTFILSLIWFAIYSQPDDKYISLDAANPIDFKGDHIIYQNKKIELGPKAFFIDGQFSDKDLQNYKYVYNSVNEAAKHLSNGTEDDPMVLYIAPYVYWIDNPDDPEIRLPKQVGGTPFGLEIECEWLKFYGLNTNPENVVLACNRGQTMGSKGNFTMFNIIGDGTSTENVTLGNYCNIDLEFSLKPELNREKRGSAIVQAQLAFCRGDKIFARNTHFISRLNTGPFWGSQRTLFDHCHFESTDDALNGSAVYLDCTFEFYSGKPFGHTVGTGAVFLNCAITSFTRGEQYLIKGGGPITAVDCRMEAEYTSYWGWKEKTPTEERHYQFNNKLNGTPVFIDSHHSYATVEMKDKNILNAYRFEYKGKVVYNIYNLLRGDDEWDPMNMKDVVAAAEKENKQSYHDLPTQLKIQPTRVSIETGKESVVLSAQLLKFGNYDIKAENISWKVAPEFNGLVSLKPGNNGTCEVIATNENDETKEVVIVAFTPEGLEAASVIYVKPAFLEAPKFSEFPKIEMYADGKLNVTYKLDMDFEDQSLVSWYRCSDAEGKNPIEVQVSRFDSPNLEYTLTSADLGFYIMATVAPNHLRCKPGTPVASVFNKQISSADIHTKNKTLKPNLQTLSTKYQSVVLPGFWTLDCYAPEDTHFYDWEADTTKDAWYYGPGVNGASLDTGLVQATKGARLRYTPVGNSFGNMKVSFTACPSKTAGQGFSSARAQYMDIFIKFDTKTLSGYALRLIRTTKYHDAIDCVFVEYENGNAKPIGDAVSTSCYRTPCMITVEAKGNKLIAHAKTTAEYFITPNRPEVLLEMDLERTFTPNKFGGFGFQHTGTVGSGATLIKDLNIEWE
jgi:hypothetical protein